MPYLDETGLNTLVEEIKKKTSSVENTLNNKLVEIDDRVSTLETKTGGSTTFTSDKVLVTSDKGKITTSSNITTTELNYLDNVTGNIQTQLNSKSSSSHTHALDEKKITGILPVNKGGTGATTASDARANLDITPSNIGAAISSHTHSLSEDSIKGFLPVSKGGTGANTSISARENLGIRFTQTGKVEVPLNGTKGGSLQVVPLLEKKFYVEHVFAMVTYVNTSKTGETANDASRYISVLATPDKSDKQKVHYLINNTHTKNMWVNVEFLAIGYYGF